MNKPVLIFSAILLIALMMVTACNSKDNPVSPTAAVENTGISPSPQPATPVTPPPGSTLPLVGTPAVVTGKWQTFSNGSDVLDLLVNGNEVWAATTGGVVCWNIQDGTNRKYTTLDGLAGNSVRKIVRDTQGNIWVTGTVDGVSRFDGNQWQTFTTENGLVSNDVITLAADKKGGIWVSAFWGVSYFDGKQWSSYSNIDPDEIVIGGSNPMKDSKNLTFIDMELSAVDVIFIDSRGNTWFSSRSKGTTRYDGINWKAYTEADGLSKGGVSAFFEDKTGSLWVGSASGTVSRMKGDQWEVFTISEKIPRAYVQNIAQDSNGDIWVSSYPDVVVRYDGASWRNFTNEDGLPDNKVKLFFKDKNDILCAVTASGLSRYEGGAWRPFTDKEKLSGTVRSVGKDDKGNLWFGTDSGIIRFNGIAWNTFVTGDGLADNTVTALAEDNRQAVWFGARDGSVSRYDSTGWKIFKPDEVQTGGYVLSMLADSRGNIWVIGESGISRYDGSKWQAITAKDGLSEGRITTMFQDRSGNIWVGSDSGGVSRFDGTGWKTFTAAEGPGSNTVMDIAQDEKGNLWFGGNSISRFDGTNWKTFGSVDSIHSILTGKGEEVWFVTEKGGVMHFNGVDIQTLPDGLPSMPWLGGTLLDSKGNVWIAKFNDHGGGLHRFDGDKWDTFTPDDGLTGYQVSGLVEDKRGNIWAATNNGVSYFNGTEWHSFTARDGLTGNNVLCVMEDSRGNLWFGTYGGVSCYSR
jgi:ligand-binding sensor domain-containing protein